MAIPSRSIGLSSAKLIVGLILGLFLTTMALAQIDRAALEGTISDQSGATVVGATVKVLEVDTGIASERKTTSNGYYRFPGLAVGRYSVTVMQTGFNTKVIND